MTRVLLSIDDAMLREAVTRELAQAGHVVLDMQRSLAVLSLPSRLGWDAVVLDNSDLGHEALSTLAGISTPGRIIALGFDAESVDLSLPLPLTNGAIVSAVAPVASEAGLRLDQNRRIISKGGREALLTPTESRLLDVLLSHSPREVSLHEVLASVWGFTDGEATSELVRNHVRNLRAKLASIGLPEAVRSRRGRGYAFVAG